MDQTTPVQGPTSPPPMLIAEAKTIVRPSGKNEKLRLVGLDLSGYFCRLRGFFWIVNFGRGGAPYRQIRDKRGIVGSVPLVTFC
jgi:hypothetical protein